MLLERLEPTPAMVMNRLTDVLAHTGGFARLMAPVGLLDHALADLVRFTLTDRAPAPRTRTGLRSPTPGSRPWGSCSSSPTRT